MNRLLDAIGQLSLALVSRYRTGGVIINEHVLSREETRIHVEVLGRSFDFVHLSDLPYCMSRHKSRRPFCLLTFDDGKRSNATAVAPELERLGVPAVFFVVSSSVGSKKALWFDRYRALQEKLGVAPLGLSLRILKQLPYDMLMARLDHACLHYGVEPDLEDDNVCPMTWEDVRGLRQNGFGIGAHGDTHAILTLETEAAARSNIEKSIAKVSGEIGSQCDSFAFPNGNYTPDLAQHALRCGVKFVMTTEPTWVDSTFAPWRLPRVQLFGFYSRGKMAFKTAVAARGLFLSNPDGTGRIYRKINRVARRTLRRDRSISAVRPHEYAAQPRIWP